MLEKTLKHILTNEMVTFPPDQQVSEVIRIMQARRISCIVVVDEKHAPIGIFTERNLVKLAADKKAGLQNIEIQEVMTSPVLSASAEVGVHVAYNMLVTHRIRHLVVVGPQGEACGIVTQTDIMDYLGYEHFVQLKKICHVMTKVVFTMPEGSLVTDALAQMAKKAISCLVISRDEIPVGILTERDAARLMVEYDDLSGLTVEEVMSRSMRTILNSSPLHNAVEMMKKFKLRRLIVVDKQGRIEGLATQSDIIQGLEAKYIQSLNNMIKEKDRAIEKTSRDLALQSAYLNNILESSVDNGIVATDPACRVKYFNPAAEKILGCRAKEAHGAYLHDVLDKRQCCNKIDFEKITQQVSEVKSHTVICEQYLPDGIRYIQAHTSEILDKNGVNNGYSLMLRDITDRKTAEMKLQRAHDELEQRVLERTETLVRTIEGIIKAMAYTVEMRDPYTAGHQRRVADLATSIAVELGLDEQQIEAVQMASLLHDIGKIRVPSDLLAYPGKLTEAEIAIFRPHPLIGYEILKNIEFPWPIADIILQHHELLDGSGYPNGISGDEIVTEARILTVADVVEAMSSHRPYRPALGVEAALDEIKEHAGVRYDKDVVAACVKIFEVNGYEIINAMEYRKN